MEFFPGGIPVGNNYQLPFVALQQRGILSQPREFVKFNKNEINPGICKIRTAISKYFALPKFLCHNGLVGNKIQC